MEPLTSLLPCPMLNVVDLSELNVPIEIQSTEKMLSLSDSDIYSQVRSSIQTDHLAFIRALAMPTLYNITMLKERLRQYLLALAPVKYLGHFRLKVLEVNYW